MDLYDVLVRENALTNHVILDISDTIFKIRERITPFLTISMKLAKEKGTDHYSYWLERGQLPTEVKFSGATESSAGTSLTFSDAARLKAWDVLRNRKSPFEQMYVTAVSGTTVTVVRDLGSYTGGAGLLTTGDVLDIIGDLREDTTAVQTPRATRPVSKYNLMQKCIDWAETEKDYSKVPHRGGDLRRTNINDMVDVHKMKLEKRLLMGIRSSTSLTSYVGRTSGGILYWLTKNRWNVGGVEKFTPISYAAWVNSVAANDPEQTNYTYFCGTAQRSVISRWSFAKLQANPEQSKRYGVTVETFDTGAGITADLVTIPWFRGLLGGYGVLLNMDKIVWKNLWDTQLEMNVQAAADEVYLEKIKTTATIEVHNQETLGWLYDAI